MSLINVLNVIVKQSKTPFLAPICFDIYFESAKSLRHSLTWRIVYIGAASDDAYDQVLEDAEMEVEVPGRMQFTLEVRQIIYLSFLIFVFKQGAYPDVSKLPQADIVGVTAILLTCSYNNTQEFFRVGYYVNNSYSEEFPELIENQPVVPDIEKLQRHILAEKPRVTKFQIDWEDEDVGVTPQLQMGQEEQQPEQFMAKGTQGIDRNDMMSAANIAQAQQNFQVG